MFFLQNIDNTLNVEMEKRHTDMWHITYNCHKQKLITCRDNIKITTFQVLPYTTTELVFFFFSLYTSIF